MSTFVLKKERMYHFPHNSALRKEFDFMLEKLNPAVTGKRVYTFEEICEILMIKQVEKNVFRDFHPKPHAIFTVYPPPDLPTLEKKLGKRRARKLARTRIKAYQKFIKNPRKYCKELFRIQYKPTKTWKQNWVEFVRDYADLAAYCGLLPAFFKNPYRDSPEDGYVVSDMMIEYLEDKLSFEKILMSMKYSNSSINLERYYQFYIKVRPFYCTLRILQMLHEKGVELVEYSLLAAAVACLRSEDEIPSAVNSIIQNYTAQSCAKFENKPPVNSAFRREAGRFSLSLLSFLKSAGLISFPRGKGTKYVRITDKGRKLLSEVPGKAVFYGHRLANKSLTPLLGYLLNLFEESVKRGITALDYNQLYRNLERTVSEGELNDSVLSISQLVPSPVRKFMKPLVELNPLENQYAIISTVDFASSYEAEFVDKGVSSIPVFVGPKEIVTPPPRIISSLRTSALSSVGSDYEDSLTNALSSLECGVVVPLGHKRLAERYLDIVWEVPIIDSTSDSPRMLLVLFEAKSGEAIKQLDERVLKDNIKQTLQLYRNRLHEICGIWIWVVNGEKLPGAIGIHGGARPGGKSFLEKLNELILLTMYISRPIIVTAMTVDCFIEYYNYLYSVLRQAPKPISEVTAPQFWVWGPLFRPIISWVFVHEDPEELKKRLFIPPPASRIGD